MDTLNVAGPAAVGQLLCAAAVGAASFTSLRRYIAVKSLNPDLPIEPSTEVTTIPTDTTPWYKRILSKKNGKALMFFTVLLSIEAFIIFGMPRLTTRFFLDAFWGTLEFFAMGVIVFSAMGVIYPLNETAKYVRSKPEDPIRLVYQVDTTRNTSPFQRQGVRAALSAVLSLAVLGTSYHGSTLLHPLVAAAWVAHMTGSFVLSRVRAKRIMQVLIGYVAAIPILTGAIMLGVYIFSSDSPETPAEVAGETSTPAEVAGETSTSNMATPSDWMTGIMTIFSSAIPSAGPGILIALALRFDYTLNNSPALVDSDALHVDPSVVLRSSPSFPKPHFTASILALVVSLLATPLAILMGLMEIGNKPGDASIIETLGLLVSAPAVVAAVCGVAWMRGNFVELCEYSEIWVPKKMPVKKDAEKVEAGKEEVVDVTPQA